MTNISHVRVYVLADDYAGYSSHFIAQHGASYLIELYEESDVICRILFDTAIYGDIVIKNMDLLGKKTEEVDLIVLSHCHYDHTGGLIEILKAINKRGIPIIAHPSIFRPHFVLEPKMQHVGMPEGFKREAEEYGCTWVLVNRPIKIAKNTMVTGEVEREVEFEKTPTLKLYTVKNGELVPDEMLDDMSLVIDTDEGIIVISGCSHAGIINIVYKAMKITGNDNIKAIIGGLHLIDAKEERIKKTVDYLVKLNVKKLFVGHCTGLKAECELLRRFSSKFKKLYTGMEIIL